jgi:16S rRNA U1498 N3-methylase RsmE
MEVGPETGFEESERQQLARTPLLMAQFGKEGVA